MTKNSNQRGGGLKATKNKLIRNGYPKSLLDANQKRQVKHQKNKATTALTFAFRIPFVSDQLNHQIRADTSQAQHSRPSCQSPRKNNERSHASPWRYAGEDLSQPILPSPRDMPAIERGLCCVVHTLRRVLCRNDDMEVAWPSQGTRCCQPVNETTTLLWGIITENATMKRNNQRRSHRRNRRSPQFKERVGQDKVQRVTKNQLQDHQTPAGSSATAHRGGRRHQATQTNPQPPTGDARYGLSSLIFFRSSLQCNHYQK